ncbi:DUF4087 domain-containing protein [Mesorhizobium sp. M0833]|uniref:DUF4087 domain-containing protein n=1 Tax=Mesorhizobium sp. M0833 TaxID=2957009 RepID=UPI0033392B37
MRGAPGQCGQFAQRRFHRRSTRRCPEGACDGIDNVPAFDDRQFVETNVPGSGYGYGCACMTVVTNAKRQKITRVISGQILPLARCRNDRSLPNPDG